MTIKTLRAIIFLVIIKTNSVQTKISVNQFRYPFRINVGFLFNQPIGYIREIPFDFPQPIALSEFRFENLSGIAAFHRTQNGLRLLGDFKAETKTTCARSSRAGMPKNSARLFPKIRTQTEP